MSTKHTPQPTKGNPTQTTTQPNKTITSIDDAVTVSAWDLEDTENTLEAIQGAFDDIATALQLIGRGNLLPYQIQALARITQIYALEWGETADRERQAVNKMLGGKHD